MALKEKLEGDIDVKCDMCIRDDPGIILCVDCGVFLCYHCHEYHKFSRECQGHHMMMLKEIRSEKVNIQPKAKPMHCKEHQNAKLVKNVKSLCIITAPKSKHATLNYYSKYTRERKQGKKEYLGIQSELDLLGVLCFYSTIEFSVLGHYLASSSSSLQCCIKEGSVSKSSCRSILDLAVSTISSSRRIFSAKDYREWSLGC